MIYLTLIVPLFTSLILFIFFRKNVTILEFVSLIFFSGIVTVIAKITVETVMVHDIEYLSSYVKETRKYEEWNEYISKTCSDTKCDSNGKNCITTTYDCSYVDNHPEYYTLETSTGYSENISRSRHLEIVKRFNVKSHFVDMNRHYYTNDGDMYKYVFDENNDKLVSFTTKHRYVNKVRVSNSVYKLEEPDTSFFNFYKLFHYPSVSKNNYQKSLLGHKDLTSSRKLEVLNSRLGKKKELKVFILVHKQQPYQAGLYQEQQWQGGNKNEFNISIGTDKKGNIKWCYVFSWTEEELLKVQVQNYIKNKKHISELPEIVDYLYNELDKKFVRKEFSDFSYLSVEPSLTALLLSYLAVLLFNVLYSVWLIKNKYKDS